MIVENLTRWDGDDLHCLLTKAVEVARQYAAQPYYAAWVRSTTVVVARHYSSTKATVRIHAEKRRNAATLLIRRPGRVPLGVVDALASVTDGGVGRMPSEMLTEVWCEAVAFAIGAWSPRQLNPQPAVPDGLRVRVARTKGTAAPRWLQLQLDAERAELRRLELRWKKDKARLTSRIAQLETKLE